MTKKYGPATQAVRIAEARSQHQEHSEALYLTSSFTFGSAQEAADRFSGEVAGNVYSRFTNPTVASFEQRLAALEQAERSVATSSGMAAILSTCMGLLQAGDHIIASRNIFGSTVVLFDKFMTKFGVSVTYVDLVDLAAWEAAFQPNTKLLYAETPSNPLNEILDIAALAERAKAHQAWLVIDNCFCTPALQQPLLWGADLVIHSATKFIDGQGRALGGAVCGSAALLEPIYGFLRSAGPTLSAFNAWIFLKGLETLHIRMAAHSRSAHQLALWLQTHPAVEQVFYCGLPEHPGHALAQRQQSDFGGVLAFTVKGGQAQAWQVIDHTQLLSITANLGDAKTTITHPATTTHGRLSDAEKALAGITPSLLRVAVGLEDVADIQADLAHGLDALLKS